MSGTDLVTLDYEPTERGDGFVATLSNNRPEKHNAANDAMDARFFACLAELEERTDVRAVVWRGNGRSFSSGRDTTELGVRTEDISDFDFIERGHAGTRRLFRLPCPVIAALKGWVIGGSFERALLCDMRIAAEGTRMMLPEIGHGVVPDSGGTARLFQMAGHGLAADLALTGRPMDAEEALRHGVVSRVVAVDALDDAALEIAQKIAQAPPLAVKLFCRTLSRLATPVVDASMQEESVAQSLVFSSDDYAEMKAARVDGRAPRYRGR